MKKSGFKRYICLVLAIALALASVSIVFATVKDKQDDLSDVQNEISSKQQEVNNNKKTISKLTTQINNLEKNINSTQTKIDGLTANINTTKAQINQKLEELSILEENIGDQSDDLNARLRTMYKNGNSGLLSVLLNSTSISELLNNIEMAKRIYASDSNLLLKLHAQYDQIYDAKVQLTNLKESLLSQQADLETSKSSLKADEKSLSEKKAQVQADNKELNAQIDALNAEADALVAEIKKLQSGGKYVGGYMCWPSKSSKRVTSPFGMRLHPILNTNKLHTGIDIGAAKGTDILAAASGTVIAAGYKPSSYGYYVMIDHGGNVVTLYGHSSKLLVSKGDTVKRGQVIALVGSTGMSTGNHIHFEIRINGEYQDPMDTTATYYVEPGVYYYD